MVSLRLPRIACLLFGLMLANGTALAQGSGKVPTRDEIAVTDQWELTSLFATDEAWETSFNEAQQLIGQFARFEGQLGKSGAKLLECLQFQEKVGIQVRLLYSYAAKKKDQDLGNTDNQARAQRITSMWTEISKAAAYIDPEILSISEKKLAKFVKKTPGLDLYDHYFDDLRRVQDHILPKDQEGLLSASQEMAAGPHDAFSMLTNTDFKWGMIEGPDGEDVQMSRARYYLYMQSSDRRLRHDAYKELYVPFTGNINTLTALLTTELKSHVFYADARGYDNTLQWVLSGPNIPTEVYHNLITSVNANLAPLHRWAEIKKRVLGVEELHPYDTYAPLFASVEKSYTYEEAQDLVREALVPLGDEVMGIINRAFDERWIDVYENVGKRGGAYSSGTYGAHPYILMNYNGTLSSVSTLAHELGHTVHSFLSNENQPYVYHGYATFNAEVASITNEALMAEYLLEKAESDDEKLALLQEYVQVLVSTYYRQARFAEFELEANRLVEKGEPLTPEVLNSLFGELYQKYWGPAMVVDDEENLSWSRIPHFYYNYYVYTYSTSFAASQLVAQKIKDEGQPAVDAFLQFLSSGGSDYPVKLLKLAGADMSTPAPFEATAARFDNLLDQIEEILARRG